MIKQWFDNHQHFSKYPHHELYYMLYISSYVSSPCGLAIGRYGTHCIQSQYLSKVADIILFIGSLLSWGTIYCGCLRFILPQDGGDLSPTQTGAELLRTMPEWLIDFATSRLQGFLHTDTINVHLQAFLFFCWHSLLVLQIDLLIFHHMLWW